MGWFPDDSIRMCVSCPSGCLMCSSLTYCLACEAGFYLRDDNFCYSECLPRFYKDDETVNCESCPYDCYTCDKFGFCLSCNETEDYRILNSQTMRCQSRDGYFDNLVAVSVKCPSECTTCSSLIFCHSCANSYYLRADNRCYTTCLERFYADSDANTCNNCLYDCLTCDNSSSCLSCDSTTDYRQFDN